MRCCSRRRWECRLRSRDDDGGHFDQRVEALAEQLQWDQYLRVRAEIAEDVGAPLSQIEADWTDRDIAVHMAMRARKYRDTEGACPRCGTRSAGWYTFDGRLASLPDYLLERSECEGCKQLGMEEVPEDEQAFTNLRFKSSEVPTSPTD